MLQTILADCGEHRPLEAGARVAYFDEINSFPDTSQKIRTKVKRLIQTDPG